MDTFLEICGIAHVDAVPQTTLNACDNVTRPRIDRDIWKLTTAPFCFLSHEATLWVSREPAVMTGPIEAFKAFAVVLLI